MTKCDYCGKVFEVDVEARNFSADEHLLTYSNLRKTLCADCAIKAIEDDKEDGVYFDTCERCGVMFDLAKDESRFEEKIDGRLRDFWEEGPLCCDCALDEAEKLPVE